jgi:hypothetical protein
MVRALPNLGGVFDPLVGLSALFLEPLLALGGVGARPGGLVEGGDVGGDWGGFGQMGVWDGGAEGRGDGDDSCPGGERIVGFVVDGGAGADFGGAFVDGDGEDDCGLEFMICRGAERLEAAGSEVFDEVVEDGGLVCIGDDFGGAEEHDTAVVDGAVEARAGEDDAVQVADGEADLGTCALAEHATRAGAVPVDTVVVAPVEGGCDDGGAIEDVGDVAEDARVEDGINSFAVVVATAGRADGSGAVSRWLVGHQVVLPQ